MIAENNATNAELAVNKLKKPGMTSDDWKQLIYFLTMRMKPDTNPLKCAKIAARDSRQGG
jgi:hypothetical protein